MITVWRGESLANQHKNQVGSTRLGKFYLNYQTRLDFE